jgi:hypothetical protein
MNKINLLSFNHTALIARLLTIYRNYEPLSSDLILSGQTNFQEYAKQLVNDNFVYPEDKQDYLIDNLTLFLLGNKNNCFDKLVTI